MWTEPSLIQYSVTIEYAHALTRSTFGVGSLHYSEIFSFRVCGFVTDTASATGIPPSNYYNTAKCRLRGLFAIMSYSSSLFSSYCVHCLSFKETHFVFNFQVNFIECTRFPGNRVFWHLVWKPFFSWGLQALNRENESQPRRLSWKNNRGLRLFVQQSWIWPKVTVWGGKVKDLNL